MKLLLYAEAIVLAPVAIAFAAAVLAFIIDEIHE